MAVMNTNANAAANDQEFEAIQPRIYGFIERRNAFGFAAHAVKTLWVMLEDDERYWVVTPADAARLEAMGYEYAG
jgi:hypothetical protein